MPTQQPSDIDKVLAGFKDGTLSKERYRELMGNLPDDLGPHMAYTHFKEIGSNLTADYMLNFGKALQNKELAKGKQIVTYEAFSTAEEIAQKYCDVYENQGKETCKCYNTAKVQADADKTARDYYNNVTIPQWKEENRISKQRHDEKVASKEYRLRQLIASNEEIKKTSGCIWEGKTWYPINDVDFIARDMGRADCGWPNKRWNMYVSEAGKQRLERQFESNNKINEWKQTEEPDFTPTTMVNQCCSNTLNVGQGGSVAQNVVQSCNQSVVMGMQQEKEALKKQEEEQEAAAIKKKQDEQAAIAIAAAIQKEEEAAAAAAIQKEEEAAAAKKKNMQIAGAIIGVLLVLGLGFAAYKMFSGSKSGEAVAETPSAIVAETPVSV